MAFNTTLKHFTSSQELASIWATGENYLLNQLVLENDVIYRCAIAHTSGATFAADLGAGKWVAVSAAGASGSKNYVENGDFEDNNTTGWSLFNTTIDSTTKIPTGSIVAGAAGFNALSVSGSSPLAGSYSLSVSTAAGVTITTTGYGFISDAFTIDREDQAKVMGFSFYYEAVSGTMNFSGTSSNTFAVYIRDVSGGAWIQPAGVYNLVQSSGSGICSGTFQTTATGTQYQIAVLMINTVSAAVSIKFDDFQLGPQVTVQGAAISDWVSYTPTWTASSVNPSIGNGTLYGKYRRVGDSLEIFISVIAGATTTFGTGNYSFGLPSGFQIDTNKINIANAALGVADCYTGSTNGTGIVWKNSSSNLTGVEVLTTATTGASFWGSASPSAWTTSGNLSLNFTLPVAGLSSNTVMSSDTDTRVVAMYASTASGIITGAPSDVTWSTISKDTHSSFNGVTYTVPVSGYYQISGQVRIAATYVAGNAVGIALNVNSSNVMYGLARAGGAQVDVSPTLTTIRYLNAGDLVKIQVDSAGTSPSFSGGGTYNYLSINRLSGPATIAASESVIASAQRSTADGAQTYSTSPGQTFRCFTDYFPTDNVDTHGILTNTASETYATIPVSGVYEISRMCRYVASSTTLVVQNYILLGGTNQTNTTSLDGVSLAASISNSVTASDGDTISVSYVGRLNAGDIIRFKCLKYGDTNMTMLGGGTSQISIKRVGN